MDKIKGMLIGTFLGDALGTPFEHKTNLKYTGDMTTTKLSFKDRFGHETNLDNGQVSDDSEMTIILYNHIKLHNNMIDKNKLILEYLNWANHKTTFAMGRNTRFLFKGVKTIKGYNLRKNKQNDDCQSNGALMRCSPLVLVDPKYWTIDCEITNPNKICIETNIIYLTLMKDAINGIKPSLHKINKIKLSAPLLEMIKQLENNEDRDIKKQKGWCVHGLYCALYTISKFMDFGEAMNWIIKQGGDTDTNAAIAGALFGAYYGFEILNKQQTNNMNCLMNCTTVEGNKQRPKNWIPMYVKFD